MPELGRSSQTDGKTRMTIACWPRLLDIHGAPAYLSVGESTIREYVVDGLLHPVEMPGSILRDPTGRIVVHSKSRRIAKILIDRADLDRLIDQRKESAA